MSQWHKRTALDAPAVAVLEASGPQQTLARLGELRAQAPSQNEALAALGRQVGVHCWRESYDVGVPQGFLTFVAALELLPRATGLEDLLLVQALGQIQSEGLAVPPDLGDWPYASDLSHAAATEELDVSCSEGDLRSFHGRLVPLINEEARRQNAHRYLFGRSTLDLAEGGHRQLLVERATCLAERSGYQHTEASLFPASHYFVRGRPDYRTAAVLQEYIDREGPLRVDGSKGAEVLEGNAREKLVEAILEAEPASVVQLVAATRVEVASVVALAETVQSAALRLLRTADPEAWMLPVRCYLFAQSAATSSRWLRRSQALSSVIMAALFARATAEVVEPVRRLSFADSVSGADVNRLRQALDAGRRDEALAQALVLVREGAPGLDQTLMAAALRDDASQRHGHDIPFVHTVLTAAERLSPERRAEHYLGLADYLAREKAPRGVSSALGHV